MESELKISSQNVKSHYINDNVLTSACVFAESPTGRQVGDGGNLCDAECQVGAEA